MLHSSTQPKLKALSEHAVHREKETMKAKMIPTGLMILLLFCSIAVPSRAQTANPHDTLNQYVADLQSNPSDTALRGKIIALAQSMRPAPAIPEEARGHYVMATTFAEKAKSDTERAKDSSDLKLASAGFERAVAEYKAALLAAPWWADAYKKLAIAQKAAQQYDDAVASLNLYLLTQPADARDAQDEIYKLKALKQTAADQKAADEERARQAAAAARRPNFGGIWRQFGDNHGGAGTIDGTIEIAEVSPGHWSVRKFDPYSKGVCCYSVRYADFNDRQLKFGATVSESGHLEFSLTLSEDGTKLSGIWWYVQYDTSLGLGYLAERGQVQVVFIRQ